MADVAESLSKVPIFAGVKPKDLKKLVARMTERSFNEGDTITEQGRSGDGFFVIEEGDATVSIDGKVAGTDLRCHGLTAWEFRPYVQEHPEVGWPLLETLVKRLREAEARSES